MALYLQDTVHEKENASHSRLKDMVRRHVDQKMRDNTFNVCNEDRSLPGAAAWKGTPPKRQP